MKDASIGFERHMPTAALAASILFVIWSFSPALAPLADGSLMFMSGDLSSMQGPATLRAEQTNFILQTGAVTLESSRFFLLGSLGWLAEWVEFSDSQFQSMLMLVGILIGSAGIHWLVVQRTRDHFLAAALTAILVIFYFMNPWSTVRLVHLWIWITYAVLPMQLALALRFIDGGRLGHLGAYSLLLGVFGPIPHSLIYVLWVHGAASFYALIAGGRRRLALFAALPLLVYAAINAPFISILLSDPGGAAAYPEDTSLHMLEVLSRNGGLADLLIFDNFWYPLGSEGAADDILYSSSSVGIFITVLSLLAMAYGRMDRKTGMMALACIASMLIAIFLAQGMNNNILKSVVETLSENGVHGVIGPFREWARISLMIPVFMTALVCLSVPHLPRPDAAAAILAVLVLLNLAGSPSWIYLNESYSAMTMPNVFKDISIPYDARVIWLGGDAEPVPAKTVTGIERSVGWPRAPDIGSPYWSQRFKDAFSSGGLSKEEAKRLRISYVALLPGEEQPYGWMGCEETDYVMLCGTGIEPMRFDADAVESARVSGYRRIDPTRWEVEAESDGPFVLSFAEDYLPGWEARIADGGDMMVSKAMEAEGGVAFQIDEGGGKLDILVVYAPQEMFEAFRWVSAAGIAACLAMMVRR